MSNAKQQSKNKLNEVAKNLNISNQELIDFIKDKLDVVKKPTANITNDEMNYILEHFTQNNQVDSFDAYFASKNAPKPEKKEEPKKEEPKKEAPKTEKKAAPKAEKKDAPKQEQKKQESAPKAEKPKAEEKPKQDAPKAEKQPVQKPVQNKNDRFNAQQALKAGEHQKPKKPEKQDNKKQENSNKTKLDIKFSDSVVDQKIHKVDTRGSYVEMDKYNEKYENIAPLPTGKHKDNFSKKQKLTQKSQQRKSQQYSTKKETETEKLRRLELERARKQQLKVLIPDEIVVSELASRLKVTATEVIKKLMGLGEMCTINQVIDFDTASLVAEELGAKVEKEVIVTIEERLIDDSDDDGEGVERAPVVVVMGHVDHGKTSLLDKIRNANVTSTEAGGITQHIGAYRVNYNGKDITFLDTPGHEAFTAMRARGASVTDIAILVVAADDGIMPQTIEAINHAKAANVSIIVAINKMDKVGANPDNIKQQLTEHGLVVEEWGGDVICVPVSAKTGEGIDELLENVLLVAEVSEFKANPNRLAKGAVIEARLDKGRGPIATLLVQNGTLHTGDIIIAGTAVGRVRVMTNDKGETVTEAGPSFPVEITGLAEVPAAGDTFNAVEDERLARELVEQRKHAAKQEQFSQYQKVTLDNLFSRIEQGEIKELPIIVKADVQGSVEAVKQSLEKLSNDEVRVKVIHGGVGAVSESDVMLANASNAIIVGFNVRPDPVAEDNAERDGVDIRLYRIIYDAIEEITTAMKGMLAPKYREVPLGRVEVRQVYKISNVGAVSGSYVLNGKITRNAEIRVVRDGIIIADDKIASLKRFKDDAKEVAEGYECGITLEKFNDVKQGDIFEAYIMEEYRPD
ncbi:MAG: translation initiation factor IF-2 [Oscillospiraceae bacterium]